MLGVAVVRLVVVLSSSILPIWIIVVAAATEVVLMGNVEVGVMGVG